MIGARVVGCAVALALARRSVEVALLEAESDPRTAQTAPTRGSWHTGSTPTPGEHETDLILASGALRDPVLRGLGISVLPLRRADAPAGRFAARRARSGRGGCPTQPRGAARLAKPGHGTRPRSGRARGDSSRGAGCWWRARLPALAGVGAPWWNPEARAVIARLTTGRRPAHVVRAALEAIAWRVTDVVGRATEPPGRRAARRRRHDARSHATPAARGLRRREPFSAAQKPRLAALAAVGAGTWNSTHEIPDRIPPAKPCSPQRDEDWRALATWRVGVRSSSEPAHCEQPKSAQAGENVLGAFDVLAHQHHRRPPRLSAAAALRLAGAAGSSAAAPQVGARSV